MASMRIYQKINREDNTNFIQNKLLIHQMAHKEHLNVNRVLSNGLKYSNYLEVL